MSGRSDHCVEGCSDSLGAPLPILEHVPPLLDSLATLRHDLQRTRFPLELGGAAEARVTRDELVAQIDDYVLPRLSRLDAPLLAVLGGSTGAGKSTITNTLVGHEVSTGGVLRPTTRTPVLVCNPADETWFMDGGVLPDLPRSTGERPTGAGLHIVPSPNIPIGLGILDSPDIDSIEVANHDLAAQLLGAADLWLFVTTAARYADAVPWAYLARARERAIALSIIINRIPAGSEDEVGGHLRTMLDKRGLGDAQIFMIAEAPLVDERIPAAVDPIRNWLGDLVQDSEAKDALVRTTVDGVLDSMPARVERLSDAVSGQASGAEGLRALAQGRYAQSMQHLEREFDSGNMLQGEVLEAWREHVGTGEFMDKMQRGVGRFRDRIKAVFTGRSAPEQQVQGQLESNLSILVREAADAAALDVVEGWEALPGGKQMLDRAPRGLDRSSPELRSRLEKETQLWEQGVLELVAEQAGSKVAVARALSWGINSVGVTLMIAVFSNTGGVTGGEAAVAGGTAAVSQTVLSAIFGEQAVRDLARRARDDLRARLQAILDEELLRFDLLLGEVPDATSAEQLRDRLSAVDAARAGS